MKRKKKKKNIILKLKAQKVTKITKKRENKRGGYGRVPNNCQNLTGSSKTDGGGGIS